MAKKNRSVVTKSSPTFAAIQQRGTVEFNPDYTNVKHDLRRIGVLAIGFLVILVALSFFLR